MTSIYSVPSAAAFNPARFGASVPKAAASSASPTHAHEPAFAGDKMTRSIAGAIAAAALLGVTACGPTGNGSTNSPPGKGNNSSSKAPGRQSLEDFCKGGFSPAAGKSKAAPVSLAQAKKNLEGAAGAKIAKKILSAPQNVSISNDPAIINALANVPKPLLIAITELRTKQGAPLVTLMKTDKLTSADKAIEGHADHSQAVVIISFNSIIAKMNPKLAATLFTGELVDALERYATGEAGEGAGRQIGILMAVKNALKDGPDNYLGDTKAEQAYRQAMAAQTCGGALNPNRRALQPAFLDTNLPGFDNVRETVFQVVGDKWQTIESSLGLPVEIQGREKERAELVKALTAKNNSN